jgi:hypothetical protein
MKNKKLIKIISSAIFLSVILFAGSFLISNQEVDAKTYKVKVGNKSVYVRTAHGAKYAKQKAQKAFNNGKLMSGCRNVSYKCHWCKTVNPPPPNTSDRCPNIAGRQNAVPEGYDLVNGQCLQDACLNISGFQEDVPAGYQDVGGKICQLGNDFHVSCGVQNQIVAPNEYAIFVATPFNSTGNVSFSWYEDDSVTGAPLNTEISNNSVIFRKNYSTEGNKRVTVVATNAQGIKKQKTCGVMVSLDKNNLQDNLDDLNDGLIDLDGDGIPDIDLNANAANTVPTASLSIDRTLTNSTCKLTWSSNNALECFLNSKTSVNEKISLNGTKDVNPGEYFVRCVGSSLKTVETAPVSCRLNPDIREI